MSATQQPGSNRHGRRVISRDFVLFLFGIGLMVYEAVWASQRGTFVLAIFLGGLALTGSPLALQALSLLTGRSLPAPEQPSPQESSTPSSGG